MLLRQPMFGDPLVAHEPEIGVPTAVPLHDCGDDGSHANAQDDPDAVHARSMTHGGAALVCRSGQTGASQPDTIGDVDNDRRTACWHG